MSGGDIRTGRRAREILGLAERHGPDQLRRAFRKAVLVAHPDRGGDPEQLRRVIDAYRLLTDLGAARVAFAPVKAARPAAPATWPLELTVAQALRGGDMAVRLPDGRGGRLTLPAGLRTGDRVRLKTAAGPVLFSVIIARGALEIRGDHIWMTAPAPPRVLEDGGRLDVDAPSGRKSLWISPEAGARGLVRLAGQGLPARGPHGQGHLFVRLEPDPAQAESAARAQLRRFAAAWAA